MSFTLHKKDISFRKNNPTYSERYMDHPFSS